MAKAVPAIKLSRLQVSILGCLFNDYEDVQQIYNWLAHKDLTKAQVRAELKSLIRQGYVNCFEPRNHQLAEVERPDFKKLDHYWFYITPIGKRAYHLEA